MAKGAHGSKETKRSRRKTALPAGAPIPAAPILSSAGPFVDYWQLRMEGASNRLKAAKTIIEHTGSRGSLAENLLRELIAEFLPRRWAVGTGFILNADRRVSRQVDVLVYDVMTTAPVYRDGDFVALSAGTAKLAVEVKSHLDSDGIPQALENIRSIKELDPDVYGMVFAYDGVAAHTLCQHVSAWFSTAAGKNAKLARQIPNRIYNLTEKFLLVDENPDERAAAPGITYWALDALAPVPRLFLAELLSHLSMENLQDFLPTEETGPELHRI